MASQEGYTEVIDALVKAGADVSQGCTKVQKIELLVHKQPHNTILFSQAPYSVPLGIAAENGHTETVRELLEEGATVDYQNKVVIMFFHCT